MLEVVKIYLRVVQTQVRGSHVAPNSIICGLRKKSYLKDGKPHPLKPMTCLLVSRFLALWRFYYLFYQTFLVYTRGGRPAVRKIFRCGSSVAWEKAKPVAYWFSVTKIEKAETDSKR